MIFSIFSLLYGDKIMESQKIEWYFCYSCQTETRHSVLHEESRSHDYEPYCQVYQIAECLGCRHMSLVHKDIDGYSFVENIDGEREYDTDINIYPKQSNAIEGRYYLPRKIEHVYSETLIAIRERAFVLAGIGLRATLEAVCNDQNIKGSNLEEMISKLQETGVLSEKDIERLHSIRFLGNDAAHRLERYSAEQIDVVLKIVEHLLNSIYIFSQQLDGKLPKIINEYEDFLDLFQTKLVYCPKSGRYSLKILFGEHDYQRISNNCKKSFEQNLIREIEQNKFPNVKTIKNKEQAENNVQYYEITI